VAHTVDLVLYAGLVRAADASGASRIRRLLSVGCVLGIDDGRANLQELVAYRQDGRWHRVGSPAAMPERVRAKLATVCDPMQLLDAFDA
jgi:hypothetical protein